MICDKCSKKKDMVITQAYFGDEIMKMYLCTSCGSSIPIFIGSFMYPDKMNSNKYPSYLMEGLIRDSLLKGEHE